MQSASNRPLESEFTLPHREHRVDNVLQQQKHSPLYRAAVRERQQFRQQDLNSNRAGSSIDFLVKSLEKHTATAPLSSRGSRSQSQALSETVTAASVATLTHHDVSGVAFRYTGPRLARVERPVADDSNIDFEKNTMSDVVRRAANAAPSMSSRTPRSSTPVSTTAKIDVLPPPSIAQEQRSKTNAAPGFASRTERWTPHSNEKPAVPAVLLRPLVTSHRKPSVWMAERDDTADVLLVIKKKLVARALLDWTHAGVLAHELTALGFDSQEVETLTRLANSSLKPFQWSRREYQLHQEMNARITRAAFDQLRKEVTGPPEHVEIAKAKLRLLGVESANAFDCVVRALDHASVV
jgi:hypothetical protein